MGHESFIINLFDIQITNIQLLTPLTYSAHLGNLEFYLMYFVGWIRLDDQVSDRTEPQSVIKRGEPC
jgi:hypothetical protein